MLTAALAERQVETEAISMVVHDARWQLQYTINAGYLHMLDNLDDEPKLNPVSIAAICARTCVAIYSPYSSAVCKHGAPTTSAVRAA